MLPELQAGFPSQPGILGFNHASYGIVTNRIFSRAEQVRRELETDPNTHLGRPLQDRLAANATLVQQWLGIAHGELALTRNSTEAAAAVTTSLPLKVGDQVVLLSSEYSSVLRGFEVHCARVGAVCTQVPLPLPLASANDIIKHLDEAINGQVTYLVASLVTSSAAILLPMAEMSAWVAARGGILVVDAAHGPGHVDIHTVAELSPVMFGSLHKWAPTPRAVGFVWAREPYSSLLHSAEVSLTYDAKTLVNRFSWPGTYDPTARLVVAEALKTWDQWEREGLLRQAEQLMTRLSEALTAQGLIPTCSNGLLPPRLRTFLVPEVPLQALQASLDLHRVRAWTGSTDTGVSMLRVSTHIYHDDDDIQTLVQVLHDARTEAPTTGDTRTTSTT